jgi:glutathione S-transferase
MMKIHNFARGARGQRVMWLCEEMGLQAQCLQLTLFGETKVGMNLNPLVAAHFMAAEVSTRGHVGITQDVGRASLFRTSSA